MLLKSLKTYIVLPQNTLTVNSNVKESLTDSIRLALSAQLTTTGLSPKEMVDRFNAISPEKKISMATYYKYHSGQRFPSPEHLRILCSILSISRADFIRDALRVFNLPPAFDFNRDAVWGNETQPDRSLSIGDELRHARKARFLTEEKLEDSAYNAFVCTFAGDSEESFRVPTHNAISEYENNRTHMTLPSFLILLITLNWWDERKWQ